MFKSIRTNTGYDSGKRYVEFTVDAKDSRAVYVGVDDGTHNYVAPRSTGIGENIAYSNSVSYKSSGRVFSRTSALNTGGTGITVDTYSVGDVIGMAIDLDVGSLSFYKNGVLIRTIAYPAGQLTYVCLSLFGPGQQITANLSQNVPFSHAAPVGYTDWAGNPI